MVVLSGLREGFALGLVTLHSPPLLGRKPSSVKSRVSITSKLIESKRLQVLYFGHLRKTGGWGSYGHLTKDVHPEPAEGLFSIFRSFFLAPSALPTSVPGAKGHQRFRVDQETREGEKSRSCWLKSPACELVCEKDLGEVLFAGIAPGPFDSQGEPFDSQGELQLACGRQVPAS